MNRRHLQDWLFAGSLVFALLLQLLPMPPALLVLKPWWVGLVLAYWAMEAPARAGLGLAFLLGLGADVLGGELLGEQSLRLLVLAFIVHRFRARLRFFPLWQQSLAVLALLLNDRIVILMVRGFAGEALPPAGFWLAPFTGLLVWPLLFLVLDGLRLRLRGGD